MSGDTFGVFDDINAKNKTESLKWKLPQESPHLTSHYTEAISAHVLTHLLVKIFPIQFSESIC